MREKPRKKLQAKLVIRLVVLAILPAEKQYLLQIMIPMDILLLHMWRFWILLGRPLRLRLLEFCYTCVAHHQDNSEGVPGCFFSTEVEAAYDCSVEALAIDRKIQK